MIKKIDKYNRIVIPKEMQKSMGIKCGMVVDLQYDDNKIIVYPKTGETIKDFMVNELQNYKQKLKNCNSDEQTYVFNAIIIELERLLEKYDKLY